MANVSLICYYGVGDFLNLKHHNSSYSIGTHALTINQCKGFTSIIHDYLNTHLMIMMQVSTSVTVVYHDLSTDVLLVGSMDFVLQAFDCKQRLRNIIYHKFKV